MDDEKLIQLYRELEAGVKTDDCVSLLSDQGVFEESVIVGNRQAFLNLAFRALEFALKSSDSHEFDEVAGYHLPVSNQIKYAFDEFSDTWPVI